MKELLKKKRMEMKNPGIFASGDAVKEETDEEKVKAKEESDKKKSDLAPETEESKENEAGLLGGGEETPMEESEESILAKLFNPSDDGKPGIAGKVAALMKEKIGKLKK